MTRLQTLVLLGTSAAAPWGVFAASSADATSSRPRGVGPEFAKFYKGIQEEGVFKCVSVPSITISASQVNDDYCDCPDGSDEPGTAACTYLSPLSPPQPYSVPEYSASDTASDPENKSVHVVLPGYYCKNKGHSPAYVSFTYVNDGVCDYEVCCDGSDEWAGVGGVKCEDRCKKIGEEARRQNEVRDKNQAKAIKRKNELVTEAEGLKKQVEQRIEELSEELLRNEGKEEALKQKFEEVERRERGRVVRGGGGKGGKLGVLVGVARQRVEELRGALESTMNKKKALQQKVDELEGIFATFREEYNPLSSEEGVKRAVKAWEDYAAANIGDTSNSDSSAEDRDAEEIVKEDSESNGINWDEFVADEEESDVDALYKFEEYLPQSVRSWVHDKITSIRILLVENGILPDNAQPGTESKVVTDARNALHAATEELKKSQKELDEKKADLDKDYGPQDVFRALTDSCVSTDSGEYTYELCWMGKTSQKSKKGGGNTSLGSFVRFDSEIVDEEISDEGKGLGKGERLVLRFENGQGCWNGPNRRTDVVVACAAEEVIWRVAEMEKCVYRIEVGSPAVCEGGGKKEEAKGKDEL